MLQLYLPLCQDQLYLPASLPPDVSHQAPSTTQLGRHIVENPPESCTKTGLPSGGVNDDEEEEDEEEEEDDDGDVYDTDDEDDNNNAEKALPSKPPSHPPLFASATSAPPLS